jgi:hypothetical protein
MLRFNGGRIAALAKNQDEFRHRTLRWLRLIGHFSRFDKWNVCRGKAAKRTGGKLWTIDPS